MKTMLVLVVAVLCGCGQDPAAQVVKAFVLNLDEGASSEAWDLLNPDTRAVYDSTVVVLHRFGYEESSGALDSLAGGVTPEEFAGMDGRDLFIRMTALNPDVANLSGTVRSVQHVSESWRVVVLSTDSGFQEVGVELIGERWLVDLTTLTPPAEPER
ncbi:MAG: hypothetical protein R6V62_02570 [Candidatus Fermentibacteraceae bacterium]